MSRMWVIRGGEENRHVDDFIDNGVIAVGYPQIGDGFQVAKSDVAELLKADGRTQPEQRAARFENFVRDIRVGDVVLMPDTPRRDIIIGTITGGYEFHDEIEPGRYRHRRAVEWAARVSIASLPATAAHLYKQRVTLAEVSGDELETFVGNELESPARRRPTDRSTRRSGGYIGVDRPDADRLCHECGLRKHAAQFEVGSDLCADCRSDLA